MYDRVLVMQKASQELVKTANKTVKETGLVSAKADGLPSLHTLMEKKN